MYGRYALLLPTVLYTFLGSSRQLIVGPEESISALVAASMLPLAAAGSAEAAQLASTSALLVGACSLLAWVVRLGWLADYFSRPVLVGCVHGVAVVLVCGQLGKMLGVGIDADRPLGRDDSFEQRVLRAGAKTAIDLGDRPRAAAPSSAG